MIKAHYNRYTNEEQSLKEHLINVAKYGRKQAEPIGQGDILFLLGLYHDLGKANRDFQDKLEMSPNKDVYKRQGQGRSTYPDVRRRLGYGDRPPSSR